MSRPRGEIRIVLHAALANGPGTTRELALRSGVGISMTRRTLDNMVTAGDASKVDSVRRPGVKRPVPVYALSAPAGQPAQGLDLQAAFAAWR